MPYEITLKKLPLGYAENAVKGGGRVKVSFMGFFSSEDGDQLITRLEGYPQSILSLIPSHPPILPASVRAMLVIIRRDKTASVFLNDEVIAIGEARIKGGCEKGELLTTNRILDLGRIKFKGITIPDDAGVMFVFSVGWRKGFFYDFTPLNGEEPNPRTYDIEEQLGSLHSYLTFQERFKISETTWKSFFDQKWFPFTYLDNDILIEMIKHANQGWIIDDLLPRISENVKKILQSIDSLKQNEPYFNEHAEMIDQSVERYLADDYISCAAILYPRIEGILRTFHKVEGYTTQPNSKVLTEVAVKHYSIKRIRASLLLPEIFKDYLDKVYFSKFEPGTSPDVSRHSVAHGEARQDAFNLKSSTIALLIIYQLSLFFSDGSKHQNAEQSAPPDAAEPRR